MSLEAFSDPHRAPGAGPRIRDGVRVLHAAGEIDLTVVPAMLAGVPALVAGAGGIVLDMVDVTFCDSSGVRLVNSLARTCAGAGVAFCVAAPPGGAVRRVLELVGLADGLADDVDSARRRVARTGW